MTDRSRADIEAELLVDALREQNTMLIGAIEDAMAAIMYDQKTQAWKTLNAARAAYSKLNDAP